jgi:hypothetical protein
MISRSFERRDRTARRASVAKKRYRMRYTTLEDRSTSCLVSTHDRISGTHRRNARFRRRVAKGVSRCDKQLAGTARLADVTYWRAL